MFSVRSPFFLVFFFFISGAHQTTSGGPFLATLPVEQLRAFPSSLSDCQTPTGWNCSGEESVRARKRQVGREKELNRKGDGDACVAPRGLRAPADLGRRAVELPMGAACWMSRREPSVDMLGSMPHRTPLFFLWVKLTRKYLGELVTPEIF